MFFGFIGYFILFLFLCFGRKKSNIEIENTSLQSKYYELSRENSTLREELGNLKLEVIRLSGNAIVHENKQLCNENAVLKQQISEFQKQISELQIEGAPLSLTRENWIKKQYKIKENLLNEIEKYLSDRAKIYKWFAPLVADVMFVIKEKTRDESELIKDLRKSRTLHSTSLAKLSVLVSEKKQLLEENAELRWQLEYVKTLIPEIDEIIEDEGVPLETAESDDSKKLLSKEEYRSLSDTEKNKLVLERYKHKRKSKRQIGRDFERFIGYNLEGKGYKVIYAGIKNGFNDRGRDLIAKKNGQTLIVQCKYWSREKTIHEKHICQLFGTLIAYQIENPQEKNVVGRFVTHTKLSEVAQKFAEKLHIEVEENIDINYDYPLIKCHNGKEGKIYHLPMDQQYDTTIIEHEDGDFYAFTIEEAEGAGYRRAYRWHGVE